MFVKGQSGNKSGRPAFAKMIDKLCKGEDPQELFEFAFKIMRNEVRDPISNDPDARLFIPIATRWDAGKWLLERRFGKAQQNIDVTTREGAPEGAIDYSRFSDAELAQIERLNAIGTAVDGEIVPTLPSGSEGKTNG